MLRHERQSIGPKPTTAPNLGAVPAQADSNTRFLVCVTVMFQNPADGLCADRTLGSSGSAKRRRERRLRAMLLHERMTVAMALSEKKRHTSRGQNKDRTTGKKNVMNYTAKLRKTPLPTAAATENDPKVLDEGGALAAGGRPAPLSEVAGWQERVQRHCVEHLAEVCPIVQILDADVPVPLLVDQYAAIWNMEEDILVAADHLDRDFQVPELVIEVPKISLDVIPLRTSVREPQLAEQLVEVPTIVPFSSFQRIMEQTVDIPVPQGGGRQGFLRGQSSTGAEQIVDIPGGGLHRPGQSSSLLMNLVKGFFALFPKLKSAKGASHSGSELLPESSPSTRAAQLEGSVEWVRLRERHAGKTFFWNRRTNSTVWRAPAGVEVVWFDERNEEGAVFCWHRDTRASTFDLPPLPPE